MEDFCKICGDENCAGHDCDRCGERYHGDSTRILREVELLGGRVISVCCAEKEEAR